ncbi:probable G-protein coupled receptor 82 isoform X1 [Cyprinodon tularosa]|uniref:probable G-protein coupled receptor 82 isoform X1 n=1 Tax=Cyprinodon tularosa TaxID=77115 RepID=UPI0018E20E67|nr:probable G-protein coupled receptor 82 isoform X1 [Cyprinodon tularosa]
MEDTSLGHSVNNASFSLCPSAATLYFLPSFYTLLFLTALPGNFLSLWVFLRCIPSISPTHIYLSHLSISNLVMAVTVPFLAAYYAWGSYWDLKQIPCQIVLHGITPVLHINIYISLLILTGVALSRFAILIRNTHASRPSACIRLLPSGLFSSLTQISFAHSMCALLWVVAVGGIVPVTVYYSVNEAMESAAEAKKGGCKKVCYSPVVELGGSVSSSSSITLIVLFFALYLVVLLSYVTVLKHLRRSRRNANITSSQSLLARVSRNIVVIQVVLSICMLPYHIFKPIVLTLAYDPPTPQPSSCPSKHSCHPINTFIEVKNFLFFLAALRSSTDPVMYFLLDRTFRQQTLRILGSRRKDSNKKQMVWSTTEGANQKTENMGEGNMILSSEVLR